MNKKIFLKTLIVLLFMYIINPIYSLVSHGTLINKEDLKKIKIGLNSNEIIKIIGKPSIIDPFTLKTWFYIYYEISNNKIKNYNKLTLIFDNKYNLLKINTYNSK